MRLPDRVYRKEISISSACSYAANGGRGINKLERDFYACFPELVYVGDGKSPLPDDIRGLIPDFLVLGKRKIIELFGDYWHAGEDPDVRINRIRKFGYEALVIWEIEFRRHPEETVERVRNFLA